MEQFLEKRKHIYNIITSLYGSSRKYTQKDIADGLGIKIRHVEEVLKDSNFSHTKELTENNLKSGQAINPLTFWDNFDFLDIYSESDIENNYKKMMPQ